MLEIRAADGHIVPAVRVSAGGSRLVILSHGITTGRDEEGIYSRFAEDVLRPAGYDSIRFDFRGHGDSALDSAQMTVAGEVLDFMAVVEWARRQKYERLYHVATSFGASVTLLSVSAFQFTDFKAMSFWNPVVSYRNTFTHATVEWGQEYFDQARDEELAYRTGTKIPETDFTIGPELTMEFLLLKPEDVRWPDDVPLQIIHGDADSVVPYSDAKAYAARNSRVSLKTLEGVDHGFDDQIEDAFKLTLQWFNAQA